MKTTKCSMTLSTGYSVLSGASEETIIVTQKESLSTSKQDILVILNDCVPYQLLKQCVLSMIIFDVLNRL